MDKNENKGLADNQDGEFVLNESGTSVSVDAGVDFPEDKEQSGEEVRAEGEQAKSVANKVS